jgi:hypothetical protein
LLISLAQNHNSIARNFIIESISRIAFPRKWRITWHAAICHSLLISYRRSRPRWRACIAAIYWEEILSLNTSSTYKTTSAPLKLLYTPHYSSARQFHDSLISRGLKIAFQESQQQCCTANHYSRTGNDFNAGNIEQYILNNTASEPQYEFLHPRSRNTYLSSKSLNASHIIYKSSSTLTRLNYTHQ